MNLTFTPWASTAADGSWLLHNVMQKAGKAERETIQRQDSLLWRSLFAVPSLKELALPAGSFASTAGSLYLITCRARGSPAPNTAGAVEKNSASPAGTGDDFAGHPVYLHRPARSGMGSRLALGVIVGLLTPSLTRSSSIWGCCSPSTRPSPPSPAAFTPGIVAGAGFIGFDRRG